MLCLGLLHGAWSLSLAGPDPSENPPGHFPTLMVPHAIPQPPQTQPTATSCLELWAVGTPSSLPQIAALIGSCLAAISPAHTPDRAALGGACPLLLGGLSWRRLGQDLARDSGVPGFYSLGSGTGAFPDPRQVGVTAPWGDERRDGAGGRAAQDCSEGLLVQRAVRGRPLTAWWQGQAGSESCFPAQGGAGPGRLFRALGSCRACQGHCGCESEAVCR